MTAPTVTVLGGTGFIGQALVRRLLANGYLVRTVSRRASAPLSHPCLQHIQGAVSDAAIIQRSVSGASVVCHLVTGGGETSGDYQRDFIDGTHRVAQACLDANVGRLVYTSSIAALYLGGRGRVLEQDGVDPYPSKRSAYSRGKIGAEAILRQYQRSHGLPVVIVRPGIVIGRAGTLRHSGLGLWQSATCCIGWGLGRNPLPLVLVDDVADALMSACTTLGIEGQAFNLAGDVRLTASEYVGLMGRISRRRYAFHPRPSIVLQAVEIAKWLLKVVARKPENTFPSYRHLRSASMRASIDSSAAKSVLGWKPTNDRQLVINEAILTNVGAILPGDLRRATLRSQ